MYRAKTVTVFTLYKKQNKLINFIYMRVYNNTSSSLNLPLTGSTRLEIKAKSVSGNILGNSEFLSTVISNFTSDEIAFIVNGPWELNLCANIPTCTNYVVQSLEEAIERFTPKEEKKEEIKVENENKVEDVPCKCSDDCECDNKEAESCSCEKSTEPKVEDVAASTEEEAPKKKVVRRRVSKKASKED